MQLAINLINPAHRFQFHLQEFILLEELVEFPVGLFPGEQGGGFDGAAFRLAVFAALEIGEDGGEGEAGRRPRLSAGCIADADAGGPVHPVVAGCLVELGEGGHELAVVESIEGGVEFGRWWEACLPGRQGVERADESE